MSVKWGDSAKNNFDKVITNLPQFHRSIANIIVKEKAEKLANERRAPLVENQDLIKAFFTEVPPAFKEMMKRLLTMRSDLSGRIISQKRILNFRCYTAFAGTCSRDL